MGESLLEDRGSSWWTPSTCLQCAALSGFQQGLYAAQVLLTWNIHVYVSNNKCQTVLTLWNDFVESHRQYTRSWPFSLRYCKGGFLGYRAPCACPMGLKLCQRLETSGPMNPRFRLTILFHIPSETYKIQVFSSLIWGVPRYVSPLLTRKDLSDDSKNKRTSCTITNYSIFKFRFIQIGPWPTEIQGFPFPHSSVEGVGFLIFQHYSWSEPPPMVLKLGKHSGVTMLSNLINLFSGRIIDDDGKHGQLRDGTGLHPGSLLLFLG